MPLAFDERSADRYNLRQFLSKPHYPFSHPSFHVKEASG